MERINSSAEDIIGRTSDSLSFLPRTVVESYLEQERQVLETGEAMSTEQVWRHHNGEIGVNLSTKFPVRDAAGEISAVGTINIDISSQKQAERSLQKSEERFRDFSEAASDWVWEMDSDLRFSFLSPSLDRHIGQPRELSLGRSRADAYADIIGSGTSEEITSWQRHLEDLLSRRPFRNFEQRWVTPDGETRYFLNSGKPVFDASGNFAGYRGVGSNITERKQAEAMLRDIESRFRAFIDNSPSAILLKNIKGQYMLANQTWHNWFNPDGQEIVGKTVFDFYPPKHAEDVNEIDQYVIETGTVVQREIQTPFPDGIERTTIFQKFLILDSNGKVVGIGGLNTDITELRRAEE
jgi:hypothetical protein